LRFWFSIVTALTLAGCGGGSGVVSYTPVTKAPSAASAVQYAGDVNPLRVLDIHAPIPAGTGQPVPHHSGLPVVIFVHGGGFTGGSRLTYNPLSQTIANYGFVVFNVDYRLPPAVNVAGELADVATAESWVLQNAQNYGGDPTEVFVMGHSAGGLLVADTIMDPQYLAAAGASRSAMKGWLSLSGSLALSAATVAASPTVWPSNAATTLAPLLLPVAGSPPLFTSCTSNDAPFGCPDRNSIAANYGTAGLDVTTFLDPGQTHLSQVQVPEANNPDDPLYQAIRAWLFAHL
jgi:acetyl esterase/lipase